MLAWAERRRSCSSSSSRWGENESRVAVVLGLAWFLSSSSCCTPSMCLAPPPRPSRWPDLGPPPRVGGKHGYTAVFIVPTGIGASIGGFAGDALPTARVMASVVDTLITHPNVMNAASLYWPQPGMLYTEGFALDEFCAGRWGLLPVREKGHRIGLILDSGMSKRQHSLHLQVADACRASLGINVAAYATTENPVGVTLGVSSCGSSTGSIDNPSTVVQAARKLVNEAGCTAIAVVAQFPEEDPLLGDTYRSGNGIDPVGGAEAIISHLIVRELGVPAAHAPAGEDPSDPDLTASPRACAEELSHTYLACVLANLHRCPAYVTRRDEPGSQDALWVGDVDALVAPAGAFGGPGALSLAGRGDVLLVAVADNEVESVPITPALLGLCDHYSVTSYLEAAGLLAAHRCGVLPASVLPGSSPIRKVM